MGPRCLRADHLQEGRCTQTLPEPLSTSRSGCDLPITLVGGGLFSSIFKWLLRKADINIKNANMRKKHFKIKVNEYIPFPVGIDPMKL